MIVRIYLTIGHLIRADQELNKNLFCAIFIIIIIIKVGLVVIWTQNVKTHKAFLFIYCNGAVILCDHYNNNNDDSLTEPLQ